MRFLMMLLAGFFVTFSKGQENPAFNRLNVENGLSQSTVLDIAQDSCGFIWMATRDGLNRYDGIGFKTFYSGGNIKESLPSSFVKVVFKDSHNRLWIGSSSGLRIYNGRTGRFLRLRDYWGGAFDILDKIAVWRIYEQPAEGLIYVLTLEYGLYIIDTRKGWMQVLNQKNSGFNSNWIRALIVGDRGVVYAATPSAVFLLKIKKEGRYEALRLIPRGFVNDEEDLGIQDIIIPEKHKLWIGKHDDGIYIFNLLTRQLESHIPRPPSGKTLTKAFPIRVFHNDKKGSVWVGTHGAGLFRYDIVNKKWHSFQHQLFNSSSIASNFIRSFYTDKQGILWIGHEDAGISLLDPDGQKFITYTAGQTGNEAFMNIMAVYSDNDTLYFGTTINNMVRFIRKSSSVSRITFNEDPLYHQFNLITGILPYQGRLLWVGTQGSGLFVLNKQSLEAKAVPLPVKNINRLVRGSDGCLWICTNHGLFRFNSRTFLAADMSILYPSLKRFENKYIKTVFEDEGMLWIATDNMGVWKFDLKRHLLVSVSYRTSALSFPFAVNSFLKDGKIMWMATYEHGLVKYLPEKNLLKTFSVREGLPGSLILQLFKDPGGYLWLSTNKGLVRFNPADNSVKIYNQNDGTQGPEYNLCSGWQDVNKTIWFGGKTGIDGINLSRFKTSYYKPGVFFTGIEVNGKAFDPDTPAVFKKHLVLSHNENFLTINFRALNYRRPFQNKYMYRMEGIDKEWVNPGNQPSARYTDLKPGTYTFYARGSNNDGIWSPRTASLFITIRSPFWQTWWFYSLIVLCLAALFYLFYRYRLHQIRQLYMIRNRISRDLHDDIGATLSSINILTDIAKKRIVHKQAEQSVGLLEKINFQATEMVDQMSDIIWSVNPDNDHLSQLLERVRNQFVPVCTAMDIGFTLDTDKTIKDLRFGMAKRKQIYLVVKELVNNAVKYSECSRILVSAAVRQHVLHIVVSDNGKGISGKIAGDGNGLRNIKSRINEIKGSIKIDSSAETGTCISISCRLTRSGD